MSKSYMVIPVIMALVSFNNLYAQAIVKTDSLITRKQSLVLHLGGGISNYARDINIKAIGIPGSINRLSAAGTVRLMWYPNHRLRVGIESGYMQFYSYRVKNGTIPGSVSLEAIPLLVVWSMPIVKRVSIFAGFGSYILISHLNYQGAVKSRATVLGSNIAMSYTLPLSPVLGIATEAKWMNAFETKDGCVSLQVQLVWKFIQWK